METCQKSAFNVANRNKWFKPSGYYVHTYTCFDMTVHSHSRIEIMYVFTGEMQIEYKSPDGKWEKNNIIAGNYVFIDSNVPHKICVNNINTKLYNIELSVTETSNGNFSINSICAQEDCVYSFFSKNRWLFICSDDGLFLQNLLLLQKYMDNKTDNEPDSYLNYLLSAMFLLIAKQYTQNKKQVGSAYINTAINYIFENFHRGITLTALAQVCGISPNYLNSLFSQSFGYTFKGYLNRYRITRATVLLSSTNLPIDEIREQVGYNNKISFNQNFLKYVEKTPKKYRQELHKANVAKIQSEESKNTYWHA